MLKEAYHIIWTTYETPKPENRSGQWAELSELYNYIESKGGNVYVPSQIAYKTDSIRISKEVLLSDEEIKSLLIYLKKLTHDHGDSIAGGKKIHTEIITHKRIELLLECPTDQLQQVVGRLKSKTASMLIRKGEAHVWSKGFWYAQLLDAISQQTVLNYFKKHNTAKTV